MKNKVVFLLFAIAALLLTSFLYIIDTDPPYADLKKTVIEFSISTAMFFGFFTIIFFIIKYVKRLIRT